MFDYSYLENLSKEQWAWEFLRRNLEYQHDYSHFIHRWLILEKDYGTGVERDVINWQSDLRALANEWAKEMTLLDEFPDGRNNNASQDTVQIEQWMGNKWGFNSFPLSPEAIAPEIPSELSWLDPEIDLDDIRFDAQENAPVAQINFDLRYSLQDQLEAAHKDLIKLSSQLQRLGKVKLVAADHQQEWSEQIKILDDAALFEQSTEMQQIAAREMCVSGYRKILLMRG